MKKRMVVLGLAAAMSLGTCMTSFAGSWEKDDIGWWWKEDDGTYPVNCWKWLDGNDDGTYENYHFNEQGYLDVNTTIKMEEDGYTWERTVNGDGARVADEDGAAVILRNGPSPEKQTKVLLGANNEDPTAITENSDYYDEYPDLKPGVAYIYDYTQGDLIGSVMVPFKDYAILSLWSDLSYYAATIKETETYKELDLYADQTDESLIGKYCVSTDENNPYIRVFRYYED